MRAHLYGWFLYGLKSTALAVCVFQAGCASLWDAFGEGNSQSCVVTPGMCGIDERCNVATGRCVALNSLQDAGSADGGGMGGLTDLAQPADLQPLDWERVFSPSKNELHGVWGASPSEVWIVGFAGTIVLSV